MQSRSLYLGCNPLRLVDVEGLRAVGRSRRRSGQYRRRVPSQRVAKSLSWVDRQGAAVPLHPPEHYKDSPAGGCAGVDWP